MTRATGCLLLLFLTTTGRAADDPLTKVGGFAIDRDSALRDTWEFTDFKVKNSGSDTTIEAIAIRRGQISLYRWYGYDAAGVKIAEGPLGYQEYLLGEKTQIEMHLGSKYKEIKRIKIGAR